MKKIRKQPKNSLEWKLQSIFEKAFGKGSCWKVFGTHYPSSTGYAEFIKQITVLIKKWNVVDQGNEILKDFHCYR